MVMQRTDFASNGGLCKTDRGLVEVDITAPVSLGVMIFNIIYIMRRYDMFMWVTIPKNYPGSAATLPTLRDSF